MTTHDKTALCKYCRELKNIRTKYFHKPCRDCLSYGKSFPFYLLLLMMAELDDKTKEIDSLRLTVQGFYRWHAEQLQPLILKHFPEEAPSAFEKATTF